MLKLQQLREKGLKEGRKKFAERIGISFSTYRSIERGFKRNPKLSTLKTIANGLELSLDELEVLLGEVDESLKEEE